MSIRIESLLSKAHEMSASDLHLNSNRPPILRIDGILTKLGNYPDVLNTDIQDVMEQTTSDEQLTRFYQEKELDFSYDDVIAGRCRVNACLQKGKISLAFRLLMPILTPLRKLGLPDILGELSLKPRGFILVTGPTGSGKSTTMAAMINHINENQERHILTIEDPIEYIHRDNKSMIIQRNVGDDTDSFVKALKYALRHDPDVIVVGEMRDLETISTAISAAETGHLVFGTLHTIDAAETVNRIIDVFPTGQQQQIRLQLSQVLLAVLSQTLVRRKNGGRIPACEIMVCNQAIKNLIREGQVHQLLNTMQLGKKDGMQTLNQALINLVKENIVSMDDVIAHSNNLEELMSSVIKTEEPQPSPQPAFMSSGVAFSTR